MSPKPTAQRRRDRRDTLDRLLSRALRGRLTTTEAALLAEYVRKEQRVSDETRARLADSDRAIVKHREAAEDAIREAEDERDEMRRNYERACQTITAMHEAATGRTGVAPVRGVVEDVADMRRRAAEMEQRALDAEEQLTAWKSVFGVGGLETYRAALARAEQAEELMHAAHQCSNEAEQARAAAEQRADLAEGDVRTLRAGLRANGADPTQIQNLWAQIRLRNRQWREAKQRAEQAEAAAADLAQALRLTREYVGEDMLPAVEGWSWFDALRRHAPHELTAEERAAEPARPTLRERSRARWNALTPEQQAERIAALAAIDGPEVVTDRATIRDTLAEPEPEPADLPPGFGTVTPAVALADPTPTAAEAADRLRRWAVAGIPTAQLTEPCTDPAHVGYATTGEHIHGPAAH
ncbi:hypothetical protein [Streptomyces sp. NPDC000994]